MISEWISVEDKPLCDDQLGFWVCHKYIDDLPYGFMAWIKTNKGGWYGHCVIQDEVGLQGVLDEEPYDIGYSWKDVTHWMPLPEPPESREG